MIRKSCVLVLAVASLAATGCTTCQDSFVELEMDLRNHVLSQQGWNEWSWCYEDLDYPWHFAKGFKAGYRNILEGGNGCQPTLPPRLYWKPCYQTPEGRGKINAWFDGFSHGALAAQQDGYGHLQQIPLSPTARANLLSSRAPVARGIYEDTAHPPAAPALPDTMTDAVPRLPDDSGSPSDEPAVALPPAVDDPDSTPRRPYEE